MISKCYAVAQLRSCANEPHGELLYYMCTITVTLGTIIVTVKPRPVITHPKVVFLHGRVYTT